jgi:hypothetical protein
MLHGAVDDLAAAAAIDDLESLLGDGLGRAYEGSDTEG